MQRQGVENSVNWGRELVLRMSLVCGAAGMKDQRGQ